MMNITTKNIQTPLHLLAVLLVSLIILTPILIAPHWGLYSDAGQILTFPRAMIDGFPSSLEALEPKGGRWNPIFHLLTILIYWLVGESARSFYLVQWGMLAIVLVLVFQLTYHLAQNSRVAAWLSIILILVGAPFYENFITLDKVEPRVGLFTMLAFGWFAWDLGKYWDKKPSLSYLFIVFCGQFSLAICSIFSKETGGFLLPVALLMFVLLWIQKHRMIAPLPIVVIFFMAQFTAFLLFIVLFWYLADSNISLRYTNYEITLYLIGRNFLYYLRYQPEVVLTVVVFLTWLAGQIIIGRVRQWGWSDLVLSGTGLAGCAYFGGMLLWRWPLNYFLYPATIFLSITLSGLAYRYIHFGVLPTSKLVRIQVLSIGLLLVIAINIPLRLDTGMAIYAQDQVKDLLAQAIQREAMATTRLVVPLFHPNSAEVGERLEFFINRPLQENKLELFNMVEGPWVNRQDLNRYQGSVGEPPSQVQLRNAMTLSNSYIVWRYGRTARETYEAGRNWYFSPLNTGDWLLIPIGSVSNRFISARGISALYSQPEVTAYLPYTTGLQLKERFKVQVPLGFWGNRFLGWNVVEVMVIEDEAIPDNVILKITDNATTSNSLSLGENWYPLEQFNGEIFRWVNNDAEIIVPFSPDVSPELTLELEPGPGVGSKPFMLYVQNEAGQTISQHDVQKRQTISISLPQLQVDKPQRFRFHIEEGGLTTSNDPRTLNFRVFRLEWRK